MISPLIFSLFYVQFDCTHPFDGYGVEIPMSKYFHRTELKYHEICHLIGLDIRLSKKETYTMATGHHPAADESMK